SVPGAGIEYTAGLKNWSRLPPTLGSPLTSGRQASPNWPTPSSARPVLAGKTGSVPYVKNGVRWGPERAWKMDENVHPPITASAHDGMLAPNRRPCPIGSSHVLFI